MRAPLTGNTDRIQAFDWLRGIAVLVMAQTHAVQLLRAELRAAPGFHWVDFVDGLVAPSFLFAAGFSLSLVQVRAAAGGQRKARFTKSLQRVGEVLVVATLLNALWFPVLQQPHWLYRLDILHCLGLSLLVALPIVWALSARPVFVAVALGALSVVAFAVAPFGEGVTGWPARFFNEASGSTFPLLPWCGHVFAGAAVGAFVASGRARLAWAVVATAVIGFTVWKLTPWITPLYPKHELWRTGPGPHALRLMFVCWIALALMAAELWIGERLSRVRAFVDTFGQNSLAAYVFHLLFLFYEPIGGASFRAQWGGSLDYVQLSVASAALITLTYFAVHGLVVFQRGQEKRIGQPTSPREAPFSAARSD
jgi:uncharacterized membrane protein